MELKEAVEKGKEYLQSTFITNKYWLGTLIDLAEQYLAIEDKGLIPEEKKIREDVIPTDFIRGKADDVIMAGSWNECRQECILRIIKNIPSVEKINKIVLEWYKDHTGNILKNYKGKKALARAIHQFLGEKLKGE